MKIEEYTVAVKGLYPRKRVRDNLGKAGWITEINKSGFLLTRYRYNSYPSWYSDEVELDDSIRVGDDVTVCHERDPHDWYDDIVASLSDGFITLKNSCTKMSVNDVIAR